MGHVRLGVLPATRQWRQVVAFIEGGSSPIDVANATMQAAEGALHELTDDPALVHSFLLLSQIMSAARGQDFQAALRELGMEITSVSPTPTDLAAAFVQAVDRQVDITRGRTDLGELAQMAAAEVLTSAATTRAGSLFGERPDATQAALSAYATEAQFGHLARDFFARFTFKFLGYFVNRETPMHVGPGRRFNNLEEHTDFNAALETHCREASRIVERFAGGWYSKARYENDLTVDRTGRFVAYSLRKVRDELRMRNEPRRERE